MRRLSAHTWVLALSMAACSGPDDQQAPSGPSEGKGDPAGQTATDDMRPKPAPAASAPVRTALPADGRASASEVIPQHLIPKASARVPAERVVAWLSTVPSCPDESIVVSQPAWVTQLPSESAATLANLLLTSDLTASDQQMLVGLLAETKHPDAGRYLETVYHYSDALAHRAGQRYELPEDLKANALVNDSVVLRRELIGGAKNMPAAAALPLLRRALSDSALTVSIRAAQVLSEQPGFPHRDVVSALADRFAGTERETDLRQLLNR